MELTMDAWKYEVLKETSNSGSFYSAIESITQVIKLGLA